MQHKIGAKEYKNGYFSIQLNGQTIASCLTKDQALFFYRGMMNGIEQIGQKIILEDSIFALFH